MQATEKSMTIGGRVTDEQLARVDAASTLARLTRAHFIVEAVLEKADDVLRHAVPADGGK